METKMEQLAKLLMNDSFVNFSVPIDTIDGVRVSCDLALIYQESINRTDLMLVGENPFVSPNADNRCIMRCIVWKQNTKKSDLTIADVVEMLTDLIAQLGTLKYDKIRNSICPAKDVENRHIFRAAKMLTRELFAFPNIEMEYDNNICCVCHDKTSSKTRCKHDLCLLCLNKMPYTEPPDDNEYEEGDKGKTCPICREYMPEFG